jgi:Zn-dependent peptidase ImmA (M78 family)
MMQDIETAKSLIRQRAEQLTSNLIAKRGDSNPPFLSSEYASLLGIKSIDKRNLGEAGGVLIRFQNNPQIILNSNEPIVRQNFSCAHEIGHLLFSELKLDAYIKSIEYRTFDPQALRRKRSRAVETLCDEAATELLMPKQIFNKYLTELGITINSIEKLADFFKVSIQSAAIRASVLSQDSYIVMKWVRHKFTPNTILLSWPKNKLINKVIYSPINKSLTPPSSIHEALKSNQIFKGKIEFNVGKKPKRFSAEIKGYGLGEKRYILSLVSLNG